MYLESISIYHLHFKGNASKLCKTDGSWDRTVTINCVEKILSEANEEVMAEKYIGIRYLSDRVYCVCKILICQAHCNP